MNTDKKTEGYQAVEQDHFLKSLFNENCLMSPSMNFTPNIMALIQEKAGVGIEAPVNKVGKNVTFLIFGLIALINLTLVYIIWPYVSVWLPEEGILYFLLENMNGAFFDFFIRIFTHTFSFTVIFILTLASFSFFGVDDYLRKRFRTMQHNGFMF